MTHLKTHLDGLTVSVWQEKGRVFVHIQKGVFSFMETMEPGKALDLALSLSYTAEHAKKQAGAGE